MLLDSALSRDKEVKIQWQQSILIIKLCTTIRIRKYDKFLFFFSAKI